MPICAPASPALTTESERTAWQLLRDQQRPEGSGSMSACRALGTGSSCAEIRPGSKRSVERRS